jgi:hypothetical protein
MAAVPVSPRVLAVKRVLKLVGPGLLALALGACAAFDREHPQATAKEGDLLVKVENQRVELIHTFRQGEPNGLFDGVVKVSEKGKKDQLQEVNVICSLPNDPQWPSYDNLYGRAITKVSEAKGRTGETGWQILFHFDGRTEQRMGSNPGPWTAQLRDNLCRRGRFDDRPKRSQN